MNTIINMYYDKIADQVESNGKLQNIGVGKDEMRQKESIYKQFLHHHLENQSNRSIKPLPQYIRYRQIIEHSQLMKVQQSPRHAFILSLLKKVWMFELFNNFIQQMKIQYFEKDRNLKQLKVEVADRYLFELYQLKQFLIAGTINLAQIFNKQGLVLVQQIRLSNIMMLSDQNLYIILQKKAAEIQNSKQNDQHQIQYNQIKDKKQKYDLLQAFPAKSLAYIQNCNKALIYDDLKYLLNEAIDQQTNFYADMKMIFGENILCGIKVKKTNEQFDVIGIRRILAKWVQNLIQSDNQLAYSCAFHNFLKNKSLIFDSFHIKQGSNISTHQRIIDVLLQLLISSVFQGKSYNKEFGLFIYDLLRSKIVVQSVKQIKQLLQKLSTIKDTKRKIQVFRIKNRLKTHNRDVLINFKYGKILAAQIQIGLGHYGTKQQIIMKKKKYQYKHFLYQLQRSIFGPTMELMILYEDYYRSDITAKMYAVGRLEKHHKFVKGIQFTKLSCPSKHRLLQISGNIICVRNDIICRSCFKRLQIELNYLYCYQCTLFYCNQCRFRFEKQNVKAIENNKTKLITINSLQTFKLIPGFKLLFMNLKYSPASHLIMKYFQFFNIFQSKEILKIYIVDVQNNQQFQQQALRLQIHRFPSFVLYDGKVSLKVLIGASIYKLYDLVKIVSSHKMTKKCPQQHDLVKQYPADFVFWKCNQCLREKITNNELLLCCKKCLYFCCKQCGFIQSQSEKYYDDKGSSYLSTPLNIQQQINKKPHYCQKSHLLKFTRRNNTQNIQKDCAKCKKKFFFIKQYGMSQCNKCNLVYCNPCIGIVINIINIKSQLANHPLLITAFDIPKCLTCNNHYKKTYFTQKRTKNWQCIICFQTYRNKTLHLVCYTCQKNICIKCTTQLKQQPSRQHFINFCKCNGDLILQTQFINSSQIFKCNSCRGKFYINSKRYVCQNDKCNFKKKYFNFYNSKVMKAHYCQKCVKEIQKRKKHKIKIICVRQLQKLSYSINEIQQQWLLSDNLQTIQKRLKQLNVIQKKCQGRFKIQKQQFSQDLNKKILIQHLRDYKVLYFFQSIRVQQILLEMMKMNQIRVRRSNSSSIYTNLISPSKKTQSQKSSINQSSFGVKKIQMSQSRENSDLAQSQIIEEQIQISPSYTQNPFLAGLFANLEPNKIEQKQGKDNKMAQSVDLMDSEQIQDKNIQQIKNDKKQKQALNQKKQIIQNKKENEQNGSAFSFNLSGNTHPVQMVSKTNISNSNLNSESIIFNLIQKVLQNGSLESIQENEQIVNQQEQKTVKMGYLSSHGSEKKIPQNVKVTKYKQKQLKDKLNLSSQRNLLKSSQKLNETIEQSTKKALAIQILEVQNRQERCCCIIF